MVVEEGAAVGSAVGAAVGAAVEEGTAVEMRWTSGGDGESAARGEV